MTVITIRIPDSEKKAISSFVKERGGEVITTSAKNKAEVELDSEDDDEVTHGVFFGENIKRVIKAFSKK